MPKSDSSSPDKLVDRENSACSVDTVESYSGKEGKGKDKGRQREGDLRKTFSLPETETLVDDFICALRRRVLYQGRLYVFEHYLCFYSNIFGHLKIVTIPLKEVTQVRKKKYYGFSNSIGVVWRGKSDVFSSFLKRDGAYKILSYAWSKSTPYAKLLGGVEEEDTILVSSNKSSSKGDSKKVLGSVRLAKLVHRPQDGGSTRQIVYEDSSDDDDAMFHTGEAGGKGGSGELPSHHDSDSEAESDATDAAEGTEETWQPVSSPAPQPDPQATVLVDTQMDVSVHDFYKEFLSDKSQFFPTWHEARGDTKVHLSEWHKHAAVGFVRELSFITPLKQKIGPAKCLCTQTQRVRLHPGDHLIFETSQIMDIPYGDYFSVETRWDFTPLSSGKKCKVQSRLLIPFSKKTMFKSTIESSTKQLCKGANDDWVVAAKKWLEPPIPISPAAPQSVFADESTEEEHSPENKKRPTHFSRADSLKLRLSTDIPDADLLKKAPTAYRSEIARVLQLKKLDSVRQSRMSSQFSRTQMPESYLDAGEQKPGLAGRAVKALRLHPSISLALILVLFLQLGYILWRHSSHSFLPSLPWPLSRSEAARKATQHQSQPQAWQSQSERGNLEIAIATMKAAIQKLQEEVRTLTDRVEAKSC